MKSLFRSVSALTVSAVVSMSMVGCDGGDYVSHADHRSQLDDVIREMSRVASAVDELRGEVRTLAENASTLPELVDDRVDSVVSEFQEMIALVEEAVAGLESRVEQVVEAEAERIAALEEALEDVASQQFDFEAGSGDAANGRRMMRVELVEPLPKDESIRQQANAAKAEAERFKERARGVQKEMADLPRHPHWWTYDVDIRSERYRRWKEEDKRRRDEFTKRRMDFEKEARAHERRTAQLEQEYAQTRHRIVGTDGQRRITLITLRDLSAAMSRISVGTTVSWHGRVERQDAQSEEWQISMIRAEE